MLQLSAYFPHRDQTSLNFFNAIQKIIGWIISKFLFHFKHSLWPWGLKMILDPEQLLNYPSESWLYVCFCENIIFGSTGKKIDIFMCVLLNKIMPFGFRGETTM